MSSKTWLCVGMTGVLSLALSTPIAVAQGHGHGYGHEKHDRDDDDNRGHGRDDGHDYDAIPIMTAIRYVRLVWSYYSDLPPGWPNAMACSLPDWSSISGSGTLPPGLRKKMQPCL